MTRTPGAGPYVLSIDQGTTNSKALLVDGAGQVVGGASAPVGIAHPRPRWVEQDAEVLWSSVLRAVDECLARFPAVAPSAVAVTNQRESVVAWSRRTGRPLGPVLGWQDARTADECARLVDLGLDPVVRRRTGLAVDAMFSAPKMRWLLDAALARGADPADVCLGTVDSWLVWRLTGGAVFAAEAGNAARTLLFDLAALDWHAELTDAFGVPRSCLGEVRRSDGGFGTTVAAGSLPAGLPIAAVLPDSSAALYALGAAGPGSAKVTYGTGSSVMAPVPRASAAPRGVSTTLAWLTAEGPTLAREGNILATGTALDWMAGVLGASPEEAGGDYLGRLAGEVPDAAGAVLVPAFSGLGAPHWDRDATGLLTGLTAATSRAHLARAALESVTHQVVDVVDAMESDGAVRLDLLHADGGASASRLLMQMQADLLGRPVSVAASAEASAVGAALLAARATGFAPAERPGTDPMAVVHPQLSDDRRSRARAAWAAAVRQARSAPPKHDPSSPTPAPTTDRR
jgi:glycerol kinase